MKKGIGIILCLCVLAAFSACGPCRRKPPAAPPDRPRSTEQLSLADVTDQLRHDTTTGAMRFDSETTELGFTLPATWPAQRIRVEEGYGPAAKTLHSLATHATRFSYTPSDSALATTPLLTILGFARNDWPRARQVKEAPTGSVLKETETEILLAVMPAENPYPDGSDAYDQFQKAMDMSPLVLESLRDQQEEAVGVQTSRATGVYTATLPAADGPGREITLTLRQDGTAEMRTEYAGKDAPIIEQGRWTRAADIVAVTLRGKDGDGETSLSWTRDNDMLIPRKWDKSLYGEAGLPLKGARE